MKDFSFREFNNEYLKADKIVDEIYEYFKRKHIEEGLGKIYFDGWELDGGNLILYYDGDGLYEDKFSFRIVLATIDYNGWKDVIDDIIAEKKQRQYGERQD